MKNLFAGILILFTVNFLYAQEIKIYNPKADAKEELADAVKKASMENKHVFIQVGGNW
ncbi:hypothetical protein [Maribellus comscasis]|uniref:hypothetical protein n=1 Tax=Maribellus comscasis TaxID=2681766 RepID=UPI001C2D8945|nr:hypothetical protein [Maribellus comscasis]